MCLPAGNPTFPLSERHHSTYFPTPLPPSSSSMSTIAIVLGTIVCGCLNSLLTKFQDNQCVGNCDNPDVSTHRRFEQPMIQTLQMFIGEMAIYVVYFVLYKMPKSRRSGYQSLHDEHNILFRQSLLLAVPSTCDLLATTFMNVGLVYTPVSIYQMTRGGVVLFVAVLSVLFLKRRIRRLEWISLLVVTGGIAIVGYSGSSSSDDGSESSAAAATDPALVVFGITLILFAVALQAVQFVVEEKILAKYSFTPLRLVYTEGVCGVVILMVLMVALHLVFGALLLPEDFAHSPFNSIQAVKETFSRALILWSSLAIMVCISSFNFCGISLTHQISATSRSTVDSCRTLLVWLFAMYLGWESFHALQLFGFVTLVFGTLCFNGVLQPENWLFVPKFLKDPDHKNDRLIDVVDEPVERM